MATLSLGRLILPLVLIHVIHHSVHSIDTITPALTVTVRPNNTINDTTVEKSTLNPFMQTQIKQNVSLSSVNHIKSISSTHENVTEKNIHIPFVAINQKLATQSSGKIKLVEPEPITESVAHHSQFKWNSVSSGQQNSLSYKLNCTPDYMTIEVNVTGYEQPFVYLEKLKSFSICRPKIVKSIAYFHLALDDNFYRCGTTKIHDQVSGTRIYYNRVLVEDKKLKEPKSIYFKCSLPNISKILGNAPLRPKRQLVPSGSGQLVNFTEIDLPDNFMEAEILDFDQNITARAPYPNLNIKVKRNGQFVNTSLNVAPGTPLEMIIYLDDESKHVYGLLASFMKVTDNGAKQKEEVIVLNGCSIDPYIFGNFETFDNGDSVSAKFRAFKFPESNYVMFVGSVNVCLDQCKGVPCGNDIVAYGKRRRRRSIPIDIPKDVNKVYEIEMITYLQIGYGDTEKVNKKLTGTYVNESNRRSPLDNYSKLTSSAQTGHIGSAIPITSRLSNGVQQFKQSISLLVSIAFISLMLIIN